MRRLEHIGLAVNDVDSVIRTFQTLLGRRPYKAETVTEQQVRTHFIDAKTAKLELLEALDSDSAIGKYLEKRGEGIHHLAFEVEDASATMERLQREGFTVLGDSPSPGADDKQIFFVHPKQTHGVLVEFCESTPPTWTPTRVSRGDGSLDVFERGAREHPPVVVLHGAAGSTILETAPLIRRLEPRYHVIGIDLSGHGASTFPAEGTFTIDWLADDVRAVLDALEVPSAHIFGFSMGGAVALRVAHTSPDRVKRLAVLATNASWTDAVAEAMQSRLDVERLRERTPGHAAAIEQIHEDAQRLFKSLRRFIAGLPDKADEMRTTLTTVEHPTLTMAFDDDPLFPLEATMAVYRHLQNPRLSVLPGSRHSLPDAPLPALVPLVDRHFSAT